jgi:purine nucleosidase
MTFVFIVLFGISSWAAPRPLIFDHDGGVDDVAALAMILLDKNLDVKAVTITPADSFKTAAVSETIGLLKFLNKGTIEVSSGDSEGVRPFPTKWRQDSERIAKIPEIHLINVPEVPKAKDRLVDLLSKRTRYEILATGPLTNIAAALKANPSIKKNIKRIYMMGGAFAVKGNVKQPGHDGSAEWNIYNDAPSAAFVFASGIPITMVGLDATNKTPVTKKFMSDLRAQGGFPVSMLFFDVWKVISAQIEHAEYEHTYYFWDTLAAGAMIDSKVVKTVKKKMMVSTSGPNEGQTYESPQGQPVDVAIDADAEALNKMILELMAH